VRVLREAIGDDDRLETLLRSAPGKEILTERDSVERSDPEPLTQQVVIEPLFDRVRRARRPPELYGEAFAEMRERLRIEAATDPEERKRLQSEIDTTAFHACGLDSDETRFVCEDFHRVQNPRLMTDDYFESVVEVYDELAESGPLP
jgi:hypothetical protein